MGKRVLLGVDRHGESWTLTACVTDPENPSIELSYVDNVSREARMIPIHRDDLEDFERAFRSAHRDMLAARGDEKPVRPPVKRRS